MISRKLTLVVLLLVGIITFGQSQTSPFPPKPANKWQIGLNLGVPQILGDIKSEPFGGNHTPAFGVGLNVRKSLGYLLSMRLHGMYGNAYGQDFIQGSYAFNKTLNGAFANSTNENYSTGADYTGNVWVPNYKTQMGHGSLDLMVNINNLNFHTASSKFLVYAFVGVGGFIFNTQMDALNGETPYDYAAILGAFGSQNTSEQERIDAIHAVLDGEYETQAEIATPAAREEGEVRGTWVRNPSISGGFGLSYRIGTNMEIGLEHRASHYFDDLADGQRWELDGDYTDHYDMFQYTNLTFGINLGKAESVDPLWELNPLAYLYEEMAKIDVDELLKDSDNDGVLDRLDKEPNTAEGTPVDTHGVSLDSDKDGCPDSEDPEPFSSPVLPMENCQNVHVTMTEVKSYVDGEIAKIGRSTGGAADWILPYIFFDLNKYEIRPDAVPTLNQVAEIMNRYTKLEVEVVGHTDTQGSESSNMKLSENRSKSAISYLTKKGVSESRMKIVYKGEGSVIIENANTPDEHQMNRRVEFHIIKN